MEQQSHRVPGPHFKTPAPGDSFSFSHPVSGIKYTLTVQELDPQTIYKKRIDSDRWFYPTHFTAMSYTLSPKPDDDIFIRDCADGMTASKKISILLALPYTLNQYRTILNGGLSLILPIH